jgi:ATP-binding cassette subfamily C protein CydD
VRTLTRILPPGARRPWRALAPAVAAGLLAGCAAILQAALLSRALDAAFLRGARVSTLAPLLAGLVFSALARALFLWAQEALAQRFSGPLRSAVRDRLLRRQLALGPRFAWGERTGELTNTLLGGVDALDPYLAQYLPQAALAALVPALVLLAVLRADALSALVLLLTFPLIPLFTWLIGGAARERTRRQWAMLARLAARFLDALQGLPTLRAFGCAEDEAERIERAGVRYRELTLGVLRLALLSALVLEALATLGTAVIAVEVGLRLLYARVHFADALFVLLLAPEFYRPLRALGAAFHAGLSGREAAERIGALLAAPGPWAAPAVLGADADSGGQMEVRTGMSLPCGESEAAAASTARAEPQRGVRSCTNTSASAQDLTRACARAAPAIRFEAVRFAHDPRHPPALDGFTLELPAGATVALVGPTGAGKTTAAHLLLRFVEPQEGRICVDDAPLAAFAPEAWRRRIAWVSQRPHLFHGTVRENLLLARADASVDELERAAAFSGLDAVLRLLPLGLDTSVGEGGERLSGGEAQRLALARAFLKDAPVLVLDEPTAWLDAGTEAAVLAAISRLRRGRTVLLIAHRLTTAATADRVVVMGHGRVLEAGAPAELAAARGPYARLLAAAEAG